MAHTPATLRDNLAGDDFGLVQFDARGRVLATNRQAELLLGQVLHRPLGTLFELADGNQELLVALARRAHPVVVRLRSRPDSCFQWICTGQNDGRSMALILPLEPGWGARRAVESAAQRERENRWRHSEKLESLSMMAGGVAHEFNNLLMGILGNVDLVREELEDKETRVGESLDDIQRSASRAAALCQQMLAYAGKGRFAGTDLDLADLLDDMEPVLRATLKNNIELVVEKPRRGIRVTGDPAGLRTVVANLIANAAEAIGDARGRILVRVGYQSLDLVELSSSWSQTRLTPGRYVVLDVVDNGPGMDADTVGRLFDPFFTTKFTGRGLGMAAVLGIVRGHKAAIFVTSKPHHGTSVSVALPSRAVNLRASTSELRARFRGWGRVLLVDDEQLVLDVANRMLKRLGFEVVTAGDGEDGLSALEDCDDIRLVIVDMVMPRMDGAEFLEKLRQTHPELPVILSSGHAQDDVMKRLHSAERVHFVQKPYSMPVLSAALRAVLDE